MFGACVSFTVTLKEQVASGGVPFEAVQVTVVVPLGKANPEAGTQVTVGVGHPSAVGGVKVTTAVQTLGSVFLAMLDEDLCSSSFICSSRLSNIDYLPKDEADLRKRANRIINPNYQNIQEVNEPA